MGKAILPARVLRRMELFIHILCQILPTLRQNFIQEITDALSFNSGIFICITNEKLMLDGTCKKCPDYMMAAFVFEDGSDK